MAIHNGKKASFVTRRGSVIPTYRTRRQISKGVIFEMPGLLDSRKMIMRDVDMSVRIIRSVNTQPDLRISVVRMLDISVDTRTSIIRHITQAIDTKALIWHQLRQDTDVQAAIYSCFTSVFDGSAQIIGNINLDADANQSIYVYLFRESHEISV